MRICGECPSPAKLFDLLTSKVYCSEECFLIGDEVPEETVITLLLTDKGILSKKYQVPYSRLFAACQLLSKLAISGYRVMIRFPNANVEHWDCL